MKRGAAFLISSLSLWASSALADEIAGIVKSPRGPIAGASVRVLGIGSDTTTTSGQFRIHAPAGTVGKKVSLQVDKSGWTLMESNDSFIVPADAVQNPLVLMMRPSTSISGNPSAGAGQPTISISALTDAPNGPLDVQYRTREAPDLLRIEPNVGYLDLLRKGGPISPQSWWWTPFSFHAPALDFKIVNNTKQTVFFQEAVFEIEESKVDPTPVFFVHGVGYMQLPLVNLGWGGLKKCTLRFNLYATSEAPAEGPLYKYTVDATKEINDGHHVSIDAVLRGAGVDTDVLGGHWSHYSSTGWYTFPLPDGGSERLREEEVLRRQKLAVGKFADKRVHVNGIIDYVQADGASGSVTFGAEVILGEPGVGAPAPPSSEYNVKFDVDRKSYQVRAPISNALKPGDYDRFTFRIAADKSSVHTFKVKLLYNANQVFTSRKLQLAFFVSAADQSLLRSSKDRRQMPDSPEAP